MKFKNITFACALLSGLAACGGGGDSSNTPSIPVSPIFETAEFEGTWTRTDGSDTRCFTFNEFGSGYFGLNRPVVITATTATINVAVFSDAACTKKAGIFTQTSSISWSDGAMPGKTHVARAVVVTTGYSIGLDGDGTGITFTSPPVNGTTTKTLFDAEGTKLFVGDQHAAQTADGYPSALLPTAPYTK
jgi:hypothetical protein